MTLIEEIVEGKGMEGEEKIGEGRERMRMGEKIGEGGKGEENKADKSEIRLREVETGRER